jgi:hypothetical protein
MENGGRLFFLHSPFPIPLIVLATCAPFPFPYPEYFIGFLCRLRASVLLRIRIPVKPMLFVRTTSYTFATHE